MRSFNLLNHDWRLINDNGTKYSFLEGDKKSGNFTYLFFLPAGTWDKPHWHTGDSRIYVLNGSLKLSFSDHFDISRARTFNEGSLVFVPRNVIHFDGAQTDTIILGLGTAPWSTKYVSDAR